MIILDNIKLQFDDWSMTIDLTIEKGSFCALIGPSGAGKTTILNAIAGFLPHNEGQLLIDGQDMSAIPPAKRPISMLFQENNLFSHMTIWQNVALGISPSLKLTNTQTDQIHHALERCGLSGMEQRLPKELSGGQRQRASLARAILRDKPVLLLDEPFAALGPALRKNMLSLVKDLASANNQTVVMVTHHPEDAHLAADMTAFVQDGMVIQAGATSAIFETPSTALKSYLG